MLESNPHRTDAVDAARGRPAGGVPARAQEAPGHREAT